MILKGFAVYEEAVVVVEVDGSGIQGRDGFWGRGGSRRWVVGLRGWGNRPSELGCWNGMGLVGSRSGGIEGGSFATLRMTDGGRGRGVGSG